MNKGYTCLSRYLYYITHKSVNTLNNPATIIKLRLAHNLTFGSPISCG